MTALTMNYWIHLPSRSVMRLKGAGGVSFLNGLITSQVMPDSCGYGAFLNAQGRFLWDCFYSVISSEEILLDCARASKGALMTHLKTFGPLHGVETEDLDHALGVCVALGPDVETMALEGMESTHHHWGGETLVRNPYIVKKAIQECAREKAIRVSETGSIFYPDPRAACMGVRCFWPYEQLSYLPNVCLTPAFEPIYHHHRIAHGIAEGPYDLIPRESIILDYGYHHIHGVHDNKGCYVGQELVTRVLHQGVVRKGPMALQLQDGQYNKGKLKEGIWPSVGTALYSPWPGENTDTSREQPLERPREKYLFQETPDTETWLYKVGVMGGHEGEVALACVYMPWYAALEDVGDVWLSISLYWDNSGYQGAIKDASPENARWEKMSVSFMKQNAQAKGPEKTQEQLPSAATL